MVERDESAIGDLPATRLGAQPAREQSVDHDPRERAGRGASPERVAPLRALFDLVRGQMVLAVTQRIACNC